MQQPPASFLEWAAKFAAEEACLAELARRKWPGGFICPRCGHDRAHVLQRRDTRQCLACRHQSSPTVGTVFEHTKLPLAKWSAAIHLTVADKGGVSALRLSKMVGVSWPTAQSMLRKLRRAMGDRDRACWLTGLVEADDALVGGKRPGRRGRGAAGKQPVPFAVERRGERAGFLAAQVAGGVTHEQVAALQPAAGRRPDDPQRRLQRPDRPGQRNAHEPRPTPRGTADEWLPLVHPVISNFKCFLIRHLSRCLPKAAPGVPRRVRLPLQPNVLGGPAPRSAGRSRRHPCARAAQAEACLEACSEINHKMKLTLWTLGFLQLVLPIVV